MYKIGKSKMQVNMYRVVLILLLAVCWVQSQSMNTSLSPASTFNSVTKKQSTSSNTTARSGQEKSQSISNTMHKNSPNTTTSPSTTATFKTENKKSPNTKDHSISSTVTAAANSTLKPITTSTTPTSSLNTTVATSKSNTKLTNTVATSRTNTGSTNTTVATSTGTTNLTTTVSTTRTSTSSTKTIVATSTGTTNLTTTVAISTTPTSSTSTTITTSAGTTNLTTTVATSTTPTSSTKTTVATSNNTTKLTTTVATSRTNTGSINTTVATLTGTTNLTTTVAIGTTPTSSTNTTITASAGTTNLTTTVATSTTPTSSTKTTVATSNSTTIPTNTVATSRTNTSSTKTTAITTGTTHKIGLRTTVTATIGNPKLTTELKTSSRTQSPGTTKTTTPAISTVRVGKIYISEVMVGRDRDDVIQVELFVTAKANISHYTLAVFDDTQNMMQSYQLNDQSLHDGFLTVSLNNTMLGVKTNSTGIALYDATQWIKKTLNNTAGLVDALVIGTSFQTTSARLVQVLTPGCLPIVLHQNQISENKSITRCSEERRCNSSMFMYTSPSFGKSNSAICENRWKNIDTITLKFNCSCQTCDSTSINEIIHFLIQEIDKNCQCEVTALNIIDSYVACCGGTALHATIVAADSEQKDKMMKAYQTLLHSTTTVTLGHNNYTINKECGSFCCHQTILPTDSTNIKLRVAVTVTCIMVLLIIIFVVLYRRRKKRGVHQFSMVRLNEEDEDLIMDGVVDDNVVGQGATFYKNRLGS